MVDPDDAAPPRAMIKPREDATKSEAETASLVASRLLHTSLQKKASSTADGHQNDDEAPRRRPTMWR